MWKYVDLRPTGRVGLVICTSTACGDEEKLYPTLKHAFDIITDRTQGLMCQMGDRVTGSPDFHFFNRKEF